MRPFQVVAALAACGLITSTGRADSVEIAPSQIGQVTQFTGVGGGMAGLFAGLSGTPPSNPMAGVQRGLLEFNIAKYIPAGSTIQSVTLQMQLISSGGGPANTVNISLHDVTTSWTPTTVTWPNPDFSTTASNSQSVNRFSSTNPAADLYSWSSSMMIQDVQNWLDNPSSNFGWLVQGDESDAMSVRRFALGSPLTTGTGPMLEVEYSPVPEPASLTLFGLGALGLAGLVWRKRSAGSLPGM